MFSSTQTKVVLFTIVITALTAIGVIFTARFTVEETMYNQRRNEARNILRLVMLDIQHQYDSWVRYKIDAVALGREDLKQAVTASLHVLNTLDKDVRLGVLSPELARERALDWLRDYQHGSRHYCFAFDLNGKGVAHPDPKRIGVTWTGLTDLKGNDALSSVLDGLSRNNEFYSVMNWYGGKDDGPGKHLAYFRLFPAWGWVIGSVAPISTLEEEADRKRSAMMSRVRRTFSDLKFTRNGFLFMFDQNGRLLIHPDEDKAFSIRNWKAASGKPLLEELADAAGKMENPNEPFEYSWFSMENDDRGNKHVAFIQYFKALKWYVCYTLPQKDLEEPANELAGRQLNFILAFFALCALAVYFLVRQVTHPIEILTRHAARLPSTDFSTSDGSLDSLDQLAGGRHDEVGKLARAFKKMQKALQKYIVQLLEANRRLEREISERKAAEKALRESEEHLASLMKTAQGFAVFRLQYDKNAPTLFQKVFVSPSIRDIIGLEGAFDYHKMQERVHPDDRPALEQAVIDLHETLHYTGTLRIRHLKHGDYRWIQAIARGIEGLEGGLQFVNGMLLDITQRKQTEERLLQNRERLRKLGAELILAEERERRCIATDLHDDIGQSLVLSKFKLEALQSSVSDPEIAGSIRYVSNLLEDMISRTRSLTMELSPPILYELGLDAALEWLAEEFAAKYGLNVSFWEDGEERPLSDDLRVFLFRAVRELLTNVAKHARAEASWINVQKHNSSIQISVEDDGLGFDPGAVEEESGPGDAFGLFSIRERLESMGGQFQIESQPGRGTRALLVASLSGK